MSITTLDPLESSIPGTADCGIAKIHTSALSGDGDSIHPRSLRYVDVTWPILPDFPKR